MNPQPSLVIPGLDRQDIGSLLNVRTFKQYCGMVQGILEGICPFCQINPATNQTLFENKHWRIWHNPFRDKDDHLGQHLVIPHKEHILHSRGLRGEDWQSLGEMNDWAQEHFKIPGCALVMRIGDPTYNAGSVRHIHANILVPDGTGRVRVTLAKEKEATASKMQILRVFELMRQGKEFGDLDPEDAALVQDRF